jgi:predicted Zn-dependent protease
VTPLGTAKEYLESLQQRSATRVERRSDVRIIPSQDTDRQPRRRHSWRTPPRASSSFGRWPTTTPNNELGHFSLGRALLDAGQDDESVQSFDRALEINANLSKAYQLAAEACSN